MCLLSSNWGNCQPAKVVTIDGTSSYSQLLLNPVEKIGDAQNILLHYFGTSKSDFVHCKCIKRNVLIFIYLQHCQHHCTFAGCSDCTAISGPSRSVGGHTPRQVKASGFKWKWHLLHREVRRHCDSHLTSQLIWGSCHEIFTMRFGRRKWE